MSSLFASLLSQTFSVAPWQAQALIQLIEEGNTLPFIARYRKEQHGELDDQLIREMAQKLEQLQALEKRREEIRHLLTEMEQYTAEIETSLQKAETLGALEDIYRPYRPKRRTRASIAREKGLEPLAAILLLQVEKNKSPQELALPFVDEEKQVPTPQDALQGAMDILAEDFSTDPEIRTQIKQLFHQKAQIKVIAAKEENSVYQMYYDHQEPYRFMPPHRVLAMNRGEKEGFLKVSLQVDEDEVFLTMEAMYLRPGSTTSPLVQTAIEDSYNRLIAPSIENELRNDLTEKAQFASISLFGKNLKPLLMQPPIKGKRVLGMDPGIRTGCKLAVVDETGKVLDSGVIYPLPEQKQVEKAKSIVKRLIAQHQIQVAAIGNGTASRETEEFFVSLMQEVPKANLSYMIVNEAGASVYSASPLAAKEFPEYDVSIRSAISIARRLQDPLSELVKIDPKSLGVGQYQHDLKASELDASLHGVIEDCVNAVGVDLNTASAPLLRRVSGINTAVADNIVLYREENGSFSTRSQLKKVPKLGPKAFEQCAGFLRLPDGKKPLENTGVHPESYSLAEKLLEKLQLTTQTAIGKIHHIAQTYGFAKLAKELEAGQPTLIDIVQELDKPGRDPRDELPPPLLRKDVLTIDDLQVGMELKGTIRNVADFGAFVDIGVHKDGLIHISKFGRPVRHPSQVVQVADVVTVRILAVEKETQRISLQLV
ncbi:MAG: RNA-binding transcriptional accessory protein [Clostridiales bacterium]|nr:RNA-binding transcriptional accessory protein [Clostridiales bacterium]